MNRDEYLFMKELFSKSDKNRSEMSESELQELEEAKQKGLEEFLTAERIENYHRIKTKYEQFGLEALNDEEGLILFDINFLCGNTVLNPQKYKRWEEIHNCVNELQAFLIEKTEIKEDGPHPKLRRTSLSIIVKNSICFIFDAKELLMKIISLSDRFIITSKDNKSFELEISVDDIWTNGSDRPSIYDLFC